MQAETATTHTEAPATPVLLTATAASEVRRYIEEQGAAENAGLRVGVLPGGCSGFQYGLNIEDEPGEDDIILESEVDLPGLGLYLHQPQRQRRLRLRQLVHGLSGG
jgi:hypothetical protein